MLEVLKKLEEYKQLWCAAMPIGTITPPDSTFLRWADRNTSEDLQVAIMKSASAMFRKLAQGITMLADDPAKYCSSVLSAGRRAKAMAATAPVSVEALVSNLPAPSAVSGSRAE